MSDEFLDPNCELSFRRSRDHYFANPANVPVILNDMARAMFVAGMVYIVGRSEGGRYTLPEPTGDVAKRQNQMMRDAQAHKRCLNEAVCKSHHRCWFPAGNV